jgi:hypothetical protein
MSFPRSKVVEPYRKRSRGVHKSTREPEYVAKWNKTRKFEPIKVPKKSDPNNILRVIVWNPLYEVTTDTLNYLFSQYASVLRIVLFKKNGLPNAMIEFDSVEGEIFG